MPMASKVHSTSARQAIMPRQRILLCYDGSAEARRALERVGEIASVVPSRVTVAKQKFGPKTTPQPSHDTRPRPARNTDVELAMSSPAHVSRRGDDEGELDDIV
jgi:hypothetical protein